MFRDITTITRAAEALKKWWHVCIRANLKQHCEIYYTTVFKLLTHRSNLGDVPPVPSWFHRPCMQYYQPMTLNSPSVRIESNHIKLICKHKIWKKCSS